MMMNMNMMMIARTIMIYIYTPPVLDISHNNATLVYLGITVDICLFSYSVVSVNFSSHFQRNLDIIITSAPALATIIAWLHFAFLGPVKIFNFLFLCQVGIHFPFPFSVGKPIPVEKMEKPSSEAIEDLWNTYTRALQELFEENKVKFGVRDDLTLQVKWGQSALSGMTSCNRSNQVKSWYRVFEKRDSHQV